jgi:hypothetical protein
VEAEAGPRSDLADFKDDDPQRVPVAKLAASAVKSVSTVRTDVFDLKDAISPAA